MYNDSSPLHSGSFVLFWRSERAEGAHGGGVKLVTSQRYHGLFWHTTGTEFFSLLDTFAKCSASKKGFGWTFPFLSSSSAVEKVILLPRELLVKYYVSEPFQNMGPARGRVEERAAAASITQTLWLNWSWPLFSTGCHPVLMGFHFCCASWNPIAWSFALF